MSFNLIKEVVKACKDSALTPGERLVFMVLANCHNDKKRRCDPGVAALCRLTGYHRASVVRLLRRLKGRGVITVTRRWRRTSHYALHPAALVVAPCDFKGEDKKSHPAPKKSHHATLVVAPGDPETGRKQEEKQEGASEAPAARRHRAHARRRPLTPSGGSDRPRPTPSGPAARQSPRSPTPNPAIRRLLDAFCDAHREVVGQPYLVRRGRDGQHLMDALMLYDEATIVRAIPPYFADRRSIERVSASIPLFVSRIATLAGAASADLEDFTGRGQALAATESAARTARETP